MIEKTPAKIPGPMIILHKEQIAQKPQITTPTSRSFGESATAACASKALEMIQNGVALPSVAKRQKKETNAQRSMNNAMKRMSLIASLLALR